ncbi:response regulator transcription factor [Brachybacterium muris]|uniref:response regulator transcription factor n=1 Tax=Brachybacterium muris TaxID=219301 RepID=UPI0021A3636B|nr:response regulator transcription factor [Brachybacterium muris]MCT1430752.1 response regulator transcription factor [Brachybacterium muris]
MRTETTGHRVAPSRVLVVEDEAPLADLVATYLARDDYEVEVIGDGRTAIQRSREWDPAVIVLDLGLPGADGVEVCRAVRTFSDCYIIMLTARAEEIDKLIGLSVGADDYLTKPFSARELVARVGVMMRRPRQSATDASSAQQTLTFGPLTIDVAGRDVLLDGELIELTRTEFDVLATLASRPEMVFSRGQLIESVWGTGWIGDDHLVDVHIGHVRRKLGDDPAEPRFIRTVRGVGYRMGSGT